MLTGTKPYAEIVGEGPLAMSIIDNRHPRRPNEVAARWLSDPVWKMMESCWIAQPQLRLHIQEVLQVLQRILEDGQWLCSNRGAPRVFLSFIFRYPPANPKPKSSF